MKLTVFVSVLAFTFILAEASIIYSPRISHPYYTPYALGYTQYIGSPYILPHTYALELKHHRPDHKGDGQENDGKDDKLAEPEQPTSAMAQMPKKTSDLKTYTFSYPIVYTIPTPLSWPGASQFHSQDALGQYHYGYANSQSSKQELKTLDGITQGAYSYVDSNGELQTVKYVSDALGFRVAATNLPKQVEPVEIPDSADIKLAKEEHFRAQKEALDRLAEATKENNN